MKFKNLGPIYFTYKFTGGRLRKSDLVYFEVIYNLYIVCKYHFVNNNFELQYSAKRITQED